MQRTLAHLTRILLLGASVSTGCSQPEPQRNPLALTGQQIEELLLRKEHAYRSNYAYKDEHDRFYSDAFYSEEPRSAFRLSPHERHVVTVLLLYLANAQNRALIGEGILKSIRTGERGGYFRKGPTLELVENYETIGDHQIKITSPHDALATFHYHAKSLDSSEKAGPSGIDLDLTKNRIGTVGVIFTSLESNSFNADVYFCRHPPLVLDLGNYSYTSPASK